MSGFVEHPLVRTNSIEFREYQAELAKACSDQNTLLVLPTGLGKTVVALLAIADSLQKSPKKCIILAPTRVLVHQHYKTLSSHLAIDLSDIGVVTGEDDHYTRLDNWSKKVICATPQIMKSDIKNGYLELKNISMIIFDEAHRAVGDYAYPHLSSSFAEVNPGGRIIGMTASMPSDKTSVSEIISNLRIQRVETRDEGSTDVKPYVKKTDVEWVFVDLSPVFTDIKQALSTVFNDKVEALKGAGLLPKSAVNRNSMKMLLSLREKIGQSGRYDLRSTLYSAIRLGHATNLLETQNLASFLKFFEKLLLRRAMGVKSLMKEENIRTAYETARGLSLLGVEHPKLTKLCEILGTMEDKDRALVFASYRDSVGAIHNTLTKKGFRVGVLIGKAGADGLKQDEQVKIVEGLRKGVYSVLVATQVGEEGLDIAECNVVVFYDNVSSTIRFVQRKGRTGRRSEGKVYVLVTKGSRDEAYYWMGKRRFEQGRRVLARVGKGLDYYLSNN